MSRSFHEKKQAPLPSSESVLGKRLPANIDAERSVLGALLLHDEHVDLVSEILRPEDFYTIAHRTVYQAILDIAHAQKRIDLLTIQDNLSKKDALESVGGIGYLMSLQEDIPALGLVEQHAQLIK